MVLRPWVLVAAILLQNPHGVEMVWLTEQTAWLRGLAQAFGAFLDWPGMALRHGPTPLAYKPHSLSSRGVITTSKKEEERWMSPANTVHVSKGIQQFDRCRELIPPLGGDGGNCCYLQ